MATYVNLVGYLKTLDRDERVRFLIKYAKLHAETTEWYVKRGSKLSRRKVTSARSNEAKNRPVTLGSLRAKAEGLGPH